MLKYFSDDEYTREIETYSTLKNLGVPTINVIASSERALLLEDLDNSPRYRLGLEGDLHDLTVARSLAAWYKELHSAGATFVTKSSRTFYRELDLLTVENIEFLRAVTHTEDNPLWDLLVASIPVIQNKVKDLGETLTYNDFYWTNLVVSHDKTEALMFDYNLLGVGLRYNDIRNVCSSLSKEAGKAFLEAYGGYSEVEKAIDQATATLVDLVTAYKKPVFPKWAQESLQAVHNGKLEQAVRALAHG